MREWAMAVVLRRRRSSNEQLPDAVLIVVPLYNDYEKATLAKV